MAHLDYSSRIVLPYVYALEVEELYGHSCSFLEDLWIKAVGWEVLLNRKGTTWRGLPVATQSAVADAHSARSLMLTHPSLVKRPVVVAGTHVIVGVNPDAWSSVI